MIALDTNALVRFIVGDDKQQTAASLRVLQGAGIHVLQVGKRKFKKVTLTA